MYKNNKIIITGKCDLFSVENINCKTSMNKDEFEVILEAKEINFGNILKESWNDSPEILSKYSITNFKMTYKGERNDFDKNTETGNVFKKELCIQADIAIQEIWDKLLESFKIKFLLQP